MKASAKTLLALTFGLALAGRSYAADLKDGFTEQHEQVMITRNGSTQLMQNNMKLRSGIEVRTDGTVIIPGGGRTTLREGDAMTFGGTVTRAGGKVEQLNPSD